MSGVLDLVRPDLRDFAGYASARRACASGTIWLNANESPWPNSGDATGSAHRYPEPQPAALRKALAALYGVSPEQLLVGRGSDEAIDLLVRALCRPGRDAVLITPPVFGMYAVAARLQGASLIEVPLQDAAAGFECDVERVASQVLAQSVRVVFLCSPANPTGQLITLPQIATLLTQLRGHAVVVVDEAYLEYSAQASAACLLAEHDNLAVLRTLSKAHGLAAARIGVVLTSPALVAVLRNCQAPYPVPAPCAALVMQALTESALAQTAERVECIVQERERLFHALRELPSVRWVYPSQANFLLVRFVDASAAFSQLLAAGIVVRDMRAQAGLHDALRISIGNPEENAQVISILRGRSV